MSLLLADARALSLAADTHLQHRDGVVRLASAFAAGAVLLELPRRHVLSKDSAQTTELLQFLDPEDGSPPPGLPHWAALPDDFVLAMQLALLRPPPSPSSPPPSSPPPPPDNDDGDGRSRWRSWLTLASSQLNGSAHWPAAQRGWLDGSHALTRASEHAERVAEQLRTVLPPLRAHDAAFFGAADGARFSDGALRSLADVVAAHSLAPVETGRPLLLPLPPLRLEFGGAASLHLLPASGAVQLRAARRLGVGDELTVDAGGHGHAAIMLRQGDPGVDPRSCAAPSAGLGPGLVPLRLALPEDDPLHELKAVLLGKASLDPSGEAFELRSGLPEPPSLLAYARVVVLQEHELPLLTAGELPRAPLCASNEDSAFRLVAAKAEAMLAAYPTSAEEDEYALGAPALGGDREADARRAAALASTLIEKRLLMSLVASLSERLQEYLRSLPTPLPEPSRPTPAATAGTKSDVGGGAGGDAGAADPFAGTGKWLDGMAAGQAGEKRKRRVRMRVRHGPIGVELVRRAIAGGGGAASGGCERLWVADVLPNGTAARAGVREGHVLLHINGTDASALAVGDVQRRLLAAAPERPADLYFVPEAGACDKEANAPIHVHKAKAEEAAKAAKAKAAGRSRRASKKSQAKGKRK